MRTRTINHYIRLLSTSLTLALGTPPLQATALPPDKAADPHIANTDSLLATPLVLPQAKGFNSGRLGLSDCKTARKLTPQSILAICRVRKADRRPDRGLRLVLVHINERGPRILFLGPGGVDAYTATLTAVTLPHSETHILFVDFAAEFHYGTQVFYLPEEGKPRLAGSIDGLALDDDQDPVSPTRYARVSGDSSGFSIRFDRPLIKIGRDGSPAAADRSTYIYDTASGCWTLTKD